MERNISIYEWNGNDLWRVLVIINHTLMVFFNVINEQKAKWKLQMAKKLAAPESLNFYVKFLTSELSMAKEVNWVRLNMFLL